jgi:hypothetical protein
MHFLCLHGMGTNSQVRNKDGPYIEKYAFCCAQFLPLANFGV